eukprot:UN20635
MVVQIAVGVSHFISRKARKTSDISLESSQLFLITFCNLKLPSKSESSKIQQNYNISYKCIMRSPTHIC